MSKKVGRPAIQQTIAAHTAEMFSAPKTLVRQLWDKYKLPFSVNKGTEWQVIEELEKMGYKAKVFPADIAAKEEQAQRRPNIAISPGLAGIKSTRSYSIDVNNVLYMASVSPDNLSGYLNNLILEERKRKGDIPQEEATP